MGSFGSTLRGKVVSDCEIYTPTGVLAGTADVTPVTDEGQDAIESFSVADSSWYPLDGGETTRQPRTIVGPDDMLVVVTPVPELFVHLTRYSVAVEVGPYRLVGSLLTHPGFDPEKSIARPGGSFIPLSEVTIELLGHPEAGRAERAHVHVNRYAVDHVTSPIMLGHFFPGAQLETQQVSVVTS
jgi:hypothetical protein